MLPDAGRDRGRRSERVGEINEVLNLNYLKDMTAPAVQQFLDSGGNIVLLPMGPTEVHGPHLPFMADFLAAEELAFRCAKTLEKEGVSTLIAPTLPYCLADVAHDFPGNVNLRYETVANLVEDICASFAVHGFKHIMVICHHGEPENLEAVLEGAERVNQKYRVNTGVSRWFFKVLPRLGEVVKSEHPEWDFHAGEWETGLMMLRHPELIDYEELEKLEPNWEGEYLFERLEKGRKRWKDLGSPKAYAGDPAIATAHVGDKCYRLISEIVIEEIRDLIK